MLANLKDVRQIPNLRLNLLFGNAFDLKDMRHIPNLRLNLLFGNALDEEGFQHTFGDGKWKLSKSSMTVARVGLCCTLYKTHLKVCFGELYAVEERCSSNLWH